MFEVWLNSLLLLVVIGGLTLLANLAEKHQPLRIVLYLSIMGVNGLLLMIPLLASVPNPEIENPPTTPEIAAAFIITLLGTGAATLILWQPVRQALVRFLPKSSQTPSPEPAIPTNDDFGMTNVLIGGEIEMVLAPAHTPTPATAPTSGGFRPGSMVHMLALVIVLWILSFQLMSYFLAGGLSGVAEDIGINTGILVANFLPQIIIPVMGVGIFLRRNPRQSLQRLGLGGLSLESFFVTIGMVFVLLFMVFVVIAIWQATVSEETFEEQTAASEALAASINTVGLAFLLAFTAGVGEEIAFRGALQPIFGFWFTAVVFVLSHIQYTLTPASLIIFVVAIVFGWLRKRYNTTTAILCHFLYNLVLSLLSVAAQEMGWLDILF